MANTWDLTDTGKDSMQKGKRLSESGSEVRETQSGYCTSYRTNDGGAGYAYTPFGTERKARESAAGQVIRIREESRSAACSRRRFWGFVSSVDTPAQRLPGRGHQLTARG